MSSNSYNATVIQKILATPSLMILRVRPDEVVPDFTPGQYTVLGLTNEATRVPESEPDEKEYEKETLIRRAYSISSASVEKEYFEFYIAQVRSGQLTPRLFALNQGDRLFIGPKVVGMFTLDQVEEDQDLLFVATGTGLAPYMSMIRSELHLYKKRNFIVLHGASCSWDLGYRDELATIDRISDNFHYLPTITAPDKDPSWNGLTEFIGPIIVSGELEKKTGLSLVPEKFHAFLCGNPMMVEGVTDILVERGFKLHAKKDPGNIHREEYWK